jgi:hypothetical protein
VPNTPSYTHDGQRQIEPPRVCRRPQPLRGWGYDEEDVEPLFA